MKKVQSLEVEIVCLLFMTLNSFRNHNSAIQRLLNQIVDSREQIEEQIEVYLVEMFDSFERAFAGVLEMPSTRH